MATGPRPNKEDGVARRRTKAMAMADPLLKVVMAVTGAGTVRPPSRAIRPSISNPLPKVRLFLIVDICGERMLIRVMDSVMYVTWFDLGVRVTGYYQQPPPQEQSRGKFGFGGGSSSGGGGGIGLGKAALIGAFDLL